MPDVAQKWQVSAEPQCPTVSVHTRQMALRAIFVLSPNKTAHEPFSVSSASELLADVRDWLRDDAKGTSKPVPNIVSFQTKGPQAIILSDTTWNAISSRPGAMLDAVQDGFVVSESQGNRMSLKAAQVAAAEGAFDEISHYATRLKTWKDVVHAKCGGEQYATADALFQVRCVSCSLGESVQQQYSGRTINDLDRFLRTHYPTCIAPGLDEVPEATAKAVADAEKRHAKHVETAETAKLVKKKRAADRKVSVEEKRDIKFKRTQSSVSDFLVPKIGSSPPQLPAAAANITPVPAAFLLSQK